MLAPVFRVAPGGCVGGWDRLHRLLLEELHTAGNLDWSRAVIDSSHVRALKGGPNPDRARSTAAGRARNTMY